VRERIAALSDRVLAELTSLEVTWRPRAHAVAPDIWWEESADARKLLA
jgi:hypothetical protein